MTLILKSSTSSLIGILGSLAMDEIKFLVGVPGEIKRLHSRFQRIIPYVDDADSKILEDERINIWVKQLREAVYEAQDVIDECRMEVEKYNNTRHQISSLSSYFSSSLVSGFLSPLSCFSCSVVHRHQIGGRIRGINQKLDDIINDIHVCKLRETSTQHTLSSIIIQKTSHLEDPDIIGATIEEDTKMLVKLLLSDEHQNKQKIVVFAITGMGGIGKTTLAQKIYNDEKISAEFRDIKPIWLCITQNPLEIDLLRLVIGEAGGDPRNSRDKEVLEPLLRSTVKDKKLFLVLDDIWDARVWEKFLYKPLQSCLVGSRVLITTRDQAVAKRMGAAHLHQVEKLCDEDGWLLLRKMVLGETGILAEVLNTFIDIGMGIVRRCDGLPLALKTIAGVLRTKDVNRRDWDDVLQNPGWSLAADVDDTTGALYISYLDLPPHLKRCFLYFSLFPEDYEFRMDATARYWIAEGFVKADRDKLLEDLAEEYWKELVYRSLLQVNITYYSNYCCRMHDLLHNLARRLASDECFYGTVQQFNDANMSSSSLSTKPRRAYILDAGEDIKDIRKYHVSLRTLICPSPSTREFTGFATAKFKCLRILVISLSSTESLPDSIGDLIHLRLLDIECSKITEIPEWIGNLKDLQFLSAAHCENLHNLPKSIVNLTNLRLLIMLGTNIQSMPAGIGRLENLVTLIGFSVLSSNLRELSSLSKLKRVNLFKLENTTRVAARAAALKAKRHLTHLELHWTACTVEDAVTYYGQENHIKKAVEIIEELCPPSGLEHLLIEGYFGDEYPSWMMEKSFVASILPEVTRIDLRNCVLCSQLPSLATLPQLDYFHIEGASAVITVGPELFGIEDTFWPELFGIKDEYEEQASCSCYFPKLRRLFFKDMPNWEEWNWLRDDEEVEGSSSILLPSLQIINLIWCPMLRSLPEGLLLHATALTDLYIDGAHHLTHLQNLLHLRRLNIKDCPRLATVSNLPSLNKLWVDDCYELKVVKGLEALQDINMEDSEIRCLPEWLFTSSLSPSASIPTAATGEEILMFPSLRQLRIRASEEFLPRCLMDGPEWHNIRLIPHVYAFHYYSAYYYIRYTKSPFFFSTNLTMCWSGNTN